MARLGEAEGALNELMSERDARGPDEHDGSSSPLEVDALVDRQAEQVATQAIERQLRRADS